MDRNELFIRIALEKGYLSVQQMHDVLKIQRAGQSELSLEQICLNYGFLSESQIDNIRNKLLYLMPSAKIKDSSDHKKHLLKTSGKSHQKKQITKTMALKVHAKRRATTKLIIPKTKTLDSEKTSDLKEENFVSTDFGNYTLLEEIARGGMGIVFRARQKEVGRIVALKVMRQLDAMDPIQQGRFKTEINAIGKLKHPNIVAIYDAGKVNDTYFFAMEFIEGRNLCEIIQKEVPSIKVSSEIMEKVAYAIHHAHAHRIIHRDLKPANIIIDGEGEPHITDFGLAKDVSNFTQLTETGVAVGTPSYMSPEQVEGKPRKICSATDVYALGAILYELLTGKPPFSGASLAEVYTKILTQEPVSPRKLLSSIPEDIETIVLKAIQKEPSNRYLTAKAFADDLKCFITGKRISARPDSCFSKVLRFGRRHSIWLVPSFLLSLLSIVFFVLWISSSCPQIDTRYSDNQKINAQLRESETLFGQNQFEIVTAKLEQMLSTYPDQGNILAVYDLLGKSHEKTGKLNEAIHIYQKLYIQARQIQEQVLALKGMMRCALKKEGYKEAKRILETLLERFNIEEQADGDMVRLAALVMFHAGEFDKAQSLIQKGMDIKSGLEEEKEYSIYKDWLESLTPVGHFPSLGATGISLLDLGDNGKKDVVLINRDSLIIQDFNSGTPNTLYSIKCILNDNAFTGRIAAGDLNGDGEKEIAAITRILDTNRHCQVIIFKKRDNNFYPFHVHNLLSAATWLWSGRLDKQSDRNDLVVGVSHYLRDTKVLRYRKGKFETIEVDKSLSKANTATNTLDVGDIDKDGRSEIIIGTADWTYYDLRAYGGYSEENPTFTLKANKKLGNVSGCKVIDMDGDGRKEILAVKSFTVNSEAFGAKFPCGEPDGLYIFNYFQGNFDEVWRYTYPASKNPRRCFLDLCGGAIKNLGNVAALRYVSSEKIKIQSIEKTKDAQEIWLIRKQGEKYRRMPFVRENKIFGCCIGDVDGDKNDELIVLEENEVLIYGLENSKTSPTVPKTVSPERPMDKLTDSIVFQRVTDLEKWGFIEEAEDWYQKLSTVCSIDEIRYQAFNKLIDILKEQGKESEKADAQEKMINAFPQEGLRLRKELLSYYTSSWQWQKARVIVNGILEKDNPQENKETLTSLLKWIDIWTNRQKIWEEGFYTPLTWSLGHPTYYEREIVKRELDAITVTGSWYHAGKMFSWKADSATLSFDIQIKKIDWTGRVCFGIFSLVRKDKLLADLICDGGSGDLFYHVYFQQELEGVTIPKKREVGSYNTGIWYRVEIDYLKEIKEARLRFWEREGETFIGEQIVKLPGPLSEGNYMLGFSMCPKRDIDHPTAFAQVSVDNIEIKGNGWEELEDYKDDKQEKEMYFIYKSNLLAQANPQKALTIYNSLIQKFPYSWRALEMRAYLWKGFGKNKEFVSDLKNVLLMNPDHPNKDQFQYILKNFEN